MIGIAACWGVSGSRRPKVFGETEMTIRRAEAREMAVKLRKRYDDPLQAVTIIGQCMTKALFAAKADKVVFWALVHAHYLGSPLCDETDRELAASGLFSLSDASSRH